MGPCQAPRADWAAVAHAAPSTFELQVSFRDLIQIFFLVPRSRRHHLATELAFPQRLPSFGSRDLLILSGPVCWKEQQLAWSRAISLYIESSRGRRDLHDAQRDPSPPSPSAMA